MIQNLKKISEKEMLRDWAFVEATSIRRMPYIKDALGEALCEKLEAADASRISEQEWESLEAMIRRNRAELLDGLLNIDIGWFEGDLSASDLKELKIMNWKPFRALAPSRNLADLVRAFERGEMPPRHHEFAANLQRIKEEFAIEKMKGHLILVGKSNEPPYVLVEGFTRLSALLLGEYRVDSLPIILGVSQNIERWKFY